MAGRWRIRHKLVLGLCLFVGILALVLAGTGYGLNSYVATMKTVSSKLAELQAAERFSAAVSDIAAVNETRSTREREQLETRIDIATTALSVYEAQLNDTLRRGRDPDGGRREQCQVEALKQGLAKVTREIKKLNDDPVPETSGSISIRNQPKVSEPIQMLVATSVDLQRIIYEDLEHGNRSAKGAYTLSLWIVGTTSVGGVLVMAGFLRFFYGLVFHPIRDLVQGADRLAQGDFEHRIDFHSGDEMEELAGAFNHMTDRLRDMYRDLERQVNERSRQLVRSERLASVGFLAAGVAHEINNPLASIAFCSEALERRIGDIPIAKAADKETVGKYLKMIQDEAFRCKNITERLLAFSRGGEKHREQTDLQELIQSVLNLVEHLQNYKGRRIVFEPAGRIAAWINAQEIKSVVLNLVVNALESMDEGGTLTIRLTQQDGMAEMTFADTGCGMAGEVLENIFEPFFTRSRTGKGTGLGLTISHRTISQHGGDIEAASAGLGQGSTFTVRLPLKDEQAADRDQKSEVRSQKPEARSQKPPLVSENETRRSGAMPPQRRAA